MKSMKVIDLVYMAVGAVLIAVCSWVSIPTTVPFTLQTFAVFFILGFLGGKKGTISILVYILLGLVGVPVFANFTSGAGTLFGTTGGYIIGFLFSGIIYWIAEKFLKKLRLTVKAAVMAAGLLVCYAFGTVWFMIVYARDSGAIGLWTALTWCVIPFIIPDLAKIALAILVSTRLRKAIHI